MIHHNLDLFYDNDNIINQHNRRETRYLSSKSKRNSLSFIDSKWYWYVFLSKSKVLYNFVCFIINHDVCVITFWIIIRSSSLSMEEIKLLAIVNWIFHVPDILKLFMMLFKYGLTLLRYSSTDSVLFLSLLLSPIVVPPKFTYSRWFIIIFFFFMLKKSIHNSFIFI